VGASEEPAGTDPVEQIYDLALPQVYGYLLTRCGSAAIAEDVTSETFLAAVKATREGGPPELSVAWLIGVARHKLVDHWRRSAREERAFTVVGGAVDDPWDDELDVDAAHRALQQLSGNHRAALTLRYLDGLTVSEVAGVIGRSVHATETLLVRARAALRRIYGEGSDEAGSDQAGRSRESSDQEGRDDG